MRHLIKLTMVSFTLTAVLAPFDGPASQAGPAPEAATSLPIASIGPTETGPVRAVRMIAIDGRYGAGRPVVWR